MPTSSSVDMQEALLPFSSLKHLTSKVFPIAETGV